MPANFFDTLITEVELARRLGRSRRTLKRWRDQPDGLPHCKLGSAVLFRVDTVVEWIAAQERRPNPRRIV
jgi:hypothetical protein